MLVYSPGQVCFGSYGTMCSNWTDVNVSISDFPIYKSNDTNQYTLHIMAFQSQFDRMQDHGFEACSAIQFVNTGLMFSCETSDSNYTFLGRITPNIRPMGNESSFTFFDMEPDVLECQGSCGEAFIQKLE